jgi:polyisoprenoid-binding protein YceI
MKKRTIAVLALASTVLAGGSPSSQTPDSGDATLIRIERGTVSFEVATNVFAMLVQGKSDALTGGTRLRESASGLRLEGLEAAVPVKSLETGIKLRDKHMREYIFRTADGQVPDVRFSAEQADCTHAAAGGEYTCLASGTLAIRARPQPCAIALRITRKGDGFRVSGEGKLALSMYGIERPTQFGVTTDDEVKIHFELDARAAATTAARVR